MSDSTADSRLHAVQHGSFKRVVVLPDGAKVDVALPDDPSKPADVAIDGKVVCAYRTLARSASLVISAIGTPHENSADHVPKYPVLQILAPADVEGCAPARIPIPDFWGFLNALHTLFHTQETIPIVFFFSVRNAPELTAYLLNSGLARKRHSLPQDIPAVQSEPELFLSRETFWQGGGTVGYHTRGWLRGHVAQLTGAPFPYVQSFTRTPLVISAHPLRPPKPSPGEVIYRKYFPSIGQTLEFTHFDLDGDRVGHDAADEALSKHLAAFHRWHNSDHVNRGWGERGPLEKHRKYVRELMADPAIIPVIMSWDGELMGYAELVYLKENHVATYVPGGAWDYDRGLHILVGEEKFRGIHRSMAWMAAIHHFCFLSDPRTLRVLGEPKASNAAVIRLSEAVGMTVSTRFDFPYKRSVMTWLTRDRFFKLDVLSFAEDLGTFQAKL